MSHIKQDAMNEGSAYKQKRTPEDIPHQNDIHDIVHEITITIHANHFSRTLLALREYHHC